MARKRYDCPAYTKKFGEKTYTRLGETFTTLADARWEANRRRKYGGFARIFKRDRGEYYVYARGTLRKPRADE